MLRVADVALNFGGLAVLSEVSFNVEKGSICGLVGPNGAGKTSLFNCITGSYVPNRGAIYYDTPPNAAADLLQLPSHSLAALGIARTFQHPTLDPIATVVDNALCGGHVHLRGNPLSLALSLPSPRRDERALKESACGIIDDLGLTPWSHVPAGNLPYAVQKRVEVARALLARPRLLLLDEPAGGLAHGEVDELATLLSRLRARFDLTILLVEHHMGLISKLTDKVVVLVEGRVVLEGTAAEVQQHPVVVEAYLGAAP